MSEHDSISTSETPSELIRMNDIKRIPVASLIGKPLAPILESPPVIFTENDVDIAILITADAYNELEIAQVTRGGPEESASNIDKILLQKLEDHLPELMYPFIQANIQSEDDRVTDSAYPLIVRAAKGKEFIILNISDYKDLTKSGGDRLGAENTAKYRTLVQTITTLQDEDGVVEWLKNFTKDERDDLLSNYLFMDESLQQSVATAFAEAVDDYVNSDPPGDEEEAASDARMFDNFSYVIQIIGSNALKNVLQNAAKARSFSANREDIQCFLAEWMSHYRVIAPVDYWHDMMLSSPDFWEAAFDGLTLVSPERAFDLFWSLGKEEAEKFVEQRLPIFLNLVFQERGPSRYIWVIDYIVSTLVDMPAHVQSAVCNHFEKHGLLPHSCRPSALRHQESTLHPTPSPEQT